MPRQCTVCAHPESLSINEALILEGRSNRAISDQYGLSRDAVRRHKQHIPQLLLNARDLSEEYEAETILQKIEDLQRETLEQLKAAKEEADNDGDRGVVLAAIREQRSNLELVAKVSQLIDERPQVNVLIAPQVQAAIVAALQPYPEARLAVVEALDELEEPSSS